MNVFLEKPLKKSLYVGLSGICGKTPYDVHISGIGKANIVLRIESPSFYVTGRRVKNPLFKIFSNGRGFSIGGVYILFPDKQFLDSPFVLAVENRFLYNWFVKKYGTGL